MRRAFWENESELSVLATKTFQNKAEEHSFTKMFRMMSEKMSSGVLSEDDVAEQLSWINFQEPFPIKQLLSDAEDDDHSMISWSNAATECVRVGDPVLVKMFAEKIVRASLYPQMLPKGADVPFFHPLSMAFVMGRPELAEIIFGKAREMAWSSSYHYSFFGIRVQEGPDFEQDLFEQVSSGTLPLEMLALNPLLPLSVVKRSLDVFEEYSSYDQARTNFKNLMDDAISCGNVNFIIAAAEKGVLPKEMISTHFMQIGRPGFVSHLLDLTGKSGLSKEEQSDNLGSIFESANKDLTSAMKSMREYGSSSIHKNAYVRMARELEILMSREDVTQEHIDSLSGENLVFLGGLANSKSFLEMGLSKCVGQEISVLESCISMFSKNPETQQFFMARKLFGELHKRGALDEERLSPYMKWAYSFAAKNSDDKYANRKIRYMRDFLSEFEPEMAATGVASVAAMRSWLLLNDKLSPEVRSDMEKSLLLLNRDASPKRPRPSV